MGENLDAELQIEMSADPIHIHRAIPDEAAAIARVLHESFKEYRPLYTDGGFAATALNEEQVRNRMSEGPVWIALSGADAVGTVAAVTKNESAYIRGMAVLPRTRGSGVGSVLLHEVEHWARSEGCVRLFLSTTPFLDSAIRLYERHGFHRVNNGPHDLFGTPLFIMEKMIST
jgi:GNAT superfamily N-acetyltransferase